MGMTYLTTIQAGQAAGLSHQRIRALCGKGLIPGAVKVGKSWIIPAHFSITRSGNRGPQSTITGRQQ